MNKKQKKVLTRIIVAAVLMVVLSLLPVDGWLKFVLFMIPYLVIGHDILLKAWKGILNRQVFDENFLMAVATIGAILLGDYKEGVAVMLFYQIGELFQSYAVGKARGSRQGNNFLIQQIQKDGIDFSRPFFLGYTGLSDALLQKYISDSAEIWKEHVDHLPIGTIGGAIGTHVGPGAIAVAFFTEK